MYLRENFPEIKFRVIYIYADYETRFRRAVMRGGEKEKTVFPSRDSSEDEQFNQFEQGLFKENVTVHFNNNEDLGFIKRCAVGDLCGFKYYSE